MGNRNFVIVPYLFKCDEELNALVRHYNDLLENCNELENALIVVNKNDHHIHNQNDNLLKTKHALIINLPQHIKSNYNQKLDAIYYAINIISKHSENLFNIHLFDDDARPDGDVINAAIQSLTLCDFSYRLCRLELNSLFNTAEQSGLYTFNYLSDSPQLWANLSISNAHLLRINEMHSNALYDELHLIQYVKLYIGNRYLYQTSPPLKIIGQRSPETYAHQKLRYCYENIRSPIRFFLDLIFLPTLYFFYTTQGAVLVIFSILLISAGLVRCSHLYWRRLPRRERPPIWSNFLAALWYAPYPLLSWIALAMRLTIGIKFGRNRILRP